MLKPTNHRRIYSIVLVLCLALGAVAPAMGQSQASSGQIAGSVVDGQGALIAKAVVKAVNTQTGYERSVSTGDDGLYTIVLLPPGMYTVTAEATGFQQATISNIEVNVGRTVDVNVTLGASGVQEVVNIASGSVQIQTTRAEADAVINEKAIENLPINGRRFQDFVTLTPAAQVDPRRQQISLSGQLGIHTNINIDGADYNQPFFGGIRGGERSNEAYTVPQEAVKEFQVVASGYSAEFGRSTGGIVNVVTKSGTNAWHGSGLYLGRYSDLSRNNGFIDAVEVNLANIAAGEPRELKGAPTRHQFGGSFGGPIKKDKAFFFVAYEQQRLRQDREVLFSGLTTFTPTADTQEAFDFFQSLQGPYEQTNDANVLLTRFDYEFNQNHRASVRYNYSRNEALNAASNGIPLFPINNSSLSNNGTEKNRVHAVVGSLASFFGTSIVNELRVQYAHERRPRLANEETPTIETGGTTSGLPRVGTVSFLPTTQYDYRIQVANAMTWSKGTHTFKFGGEYNHVYADQDFGFNQFGRFTGFSSNPASSLEVLSVGGPTANRFDNTGVRFAKQIGNLAAAYSSNELAFFAQDSWRILPNLTLNYGLRWEAQYNPEPELGNDALINLVKNTVYPSGHRPDPTQIPDDDDNFGPRIGFAWDPFSNSKTVIRGYGGVYYSRTPGLLLSTPVSNFRSPAGDLSVTLPIVLPVGHPLRANNTVYKQLNLIGIDLNDFSLGNLPIISTEQIQQLANLLGLDPNIAGIAPLLMADDYQNPKSLQAGIGVEHQVMRGLTVGADFNWIKTVYLQQNRDINLPLPTVSLTDPAQRPRYVLANKPVPALGQIQIRESVGKALYKALTLRTKFQRNWGQFNAFYVLSKNLSSTDNEREAGGVQYADAFDTSAEYNYSNLDRKHQFTFNPVFFLPYGVDFSSAIRVRSGRPIDATVSGDANGDGNFTDRPFLGPGIPFKRNSFRNRAIYSFDFRAQKRVNIAEGKQLIFSMDVFNVFNLNNIELAGTAVTNFCAGATTVEPTCGFLFPTNPNFLSLTDRNPTSPRFGQLLLTNNSGEPFQLQLGARFTF